MFDRLVPAAPDRKAGAPLVGDCCASRRASAAAYSRQHTCRFRACIGRVCHPHVKLLTCGGVGSDIASSAAVNCHTLAADSSSRAVAVNVVQGRRKRVSGSQLPYARLSATDSRSRAIAVNVVQARRKRVSGRAMRQAHAATAREALRRCNSALASARSCKVENAHPRGAGRQAPTTAVVHLNKCSAQGEFKAAHELIIDRQRLMLALTVASPREQSGNLSILKRALSENQQKCKTHLKRALASGITCCMLCER
ncbi:hypothetical protein JKP88DRAFT_268421 [Tribonema minus]|uniref:Uncharacterized protein n=1 Tax=Tribonema minus TaxID=303371 RepID=A0A835ZA50_9STRA|nr:hypothetical protein JKP88DRAFT_268421 [Tribonema minus]